MNVTVTVEQQNTANGFPLIMFSCPNDLNKPKHFCGLLAVTRPIHFRLANDGPEEQRFHENNWRDLYPFCNGFYSCARYSSLWGGDSAEFKSIKLTQLVTLVESNLALLHPNAMGIDGETEIHDMAMLLLFDAEEGQVLIEPVLDSSTNLLYYRGWLVTDPDLVTVQHSFMGALQQVVYNYEVKAVHN